MITASLKARPAGTPGAAAGQEQLQGRRVKASRLLLGQRPHAGAAYFQKPREAAFNGTSLAAGCCLLLVLLLLAVAVAVAVALTLDSEWLRKVSDEWFNKLGDDKQEVMKHFKGATFTFMTGEEAYDVITTQALEKRAPLENVNKHGQGVFVDNEYVEM
ncbi:hypothetical protein PPROV_001093600 [Pycnococcus provasolii]|uniref:Uncharacterized protein n=1 Tax=Pycnococcus provasolii TaxID=41880 RepID=A0A830HYW9_9CHLO|nr:hypothetical protein PPROV_001093600 [Pycnococcus provasolii]